MVTKEAFMVILLIKSERSAEQGDPVKKNILEN